jgi:cyclase
VSSSHHDHPELPPPYIEEVAEDVFAYVQPDGSWFINNTGFVRGQRTVLSVDTCSTERRTRDYLTDLARVAGNAPRMLVNTHHHGDHTNGNCLLPWAAVIGHHRCREEIVKAGILDPTGLFEPVEWGELEPAPPFVVFDRRLTVFVDDISVELQHLTTAAHTDNDVVAWLPERKVLYSGDLVLNGCTPFALMGSIAGSLEALDCIAELGPEVIVPGHGAPCDLLAVARCGEYLRSVQTHAERSFAAGLSPLEAAHEFDLSPFADLLDPERLVGNLHRAYAELSGVRGGAAIDYMAAFRDMLTFNNGRPLRCLARRGGNRRPDTARRGER